SAAGPAPAGQNKARPPSRRRQYPPKGKLNQTAGNEEGPGEASAYLVPLISKIRESRKTNLMGKPNLVAQEESNMLVVVLVKITVLSIDDVSSKNGLNS